MKRKLILLTVFLLLAFCTSGCKKAGTDSKDETVMNGDSTKETITTAPTAVPTLAPTIAPTAGVAETQGASAEETAPLYKDGVYKVKTEPDYESYYTEATVTIDGGKITSVDWTIYDTANNVPFDGEYYKLLEDYGAEYRQQGIDDWEGSRGYTDKLIETQDITQVDAVSGATWTNKKFKEIVEMALEQAKAASEAPAVAVHYKDGVYSVKTEPDNENYYVEATVTIEGGKITSADWWIYDAGHDNLRFDSEYYYIFEGNDEYVNQAKNDWSGSREYSVKLLETQDVNQVDAVSGATWSYVEFEQIINLALDQATEDIVPVYKDGVYEAQTNTDVDSYYAKAAVTVEGNKITNVDWSIFDAARQDLPFNKDYPAQLTDSWAVFQCENNLKGLDGYAAKLVETQNLYQVDAVSGATWANIKFRQAVALALDKAAQ